jgi:hypothetical protein
MQNRQLPSPGYFRSFGDDAPPAAEPFTIRSACHTPLADYWYKACNADFCALLENELEIATLEQCLIQGDFRARLTNSQGFTDYPTFDFAAVRLLEFDLVLPAAIIENRDMVASSQAQHIVQLVNQLPSNDYRALGNPICR